MNGASVSSSALQRDDMHTPWLHHGYDGIALLLLRQARKAQDPEACAVEGERVLAKPGFTLGGPETRGNFCLFFTARTETERDALAARPYR